MPSKRNSGKFRAQIHTATGNEFGGTFCTWEEAAITENVMRLEHGMTHCKAVTRYECVICRQDHMTPLDATKCCVPESAK